MSLGFQRDMIGLAIGVFLIISYLALTSHNTTVTALYLLGVVSLVGWIYYHEKKRPNSPHSNDLNANSNKRVKESKPHPHSPPS